MMKNCNYRTLCQVSAFDIMLKIFYDFLKIKVFYGMQYLMVDKQSVSENCFKNMGGAKSDQWLDTET